MKKNTIIYIGGFEMPDKNAAAHRVLNNAKIFCELGYHVVFCGVDREKISASMDIRKIGVFDSIPVAYPKTIFAWIKYLLDFSHVKKTLEMYDDVKYVVAYNMHAIPFFKLLCFAKKKKISVIADVTEWYENNFSLRPPKFIRWLDTNIVMRYLTKKVNRMIVISSYLKDYYCKYVKKIIVVPPLVDIDEKIWSVECPNKLGCTEFVYSGVPGQKNEKDKIGLIIDCFGKLPVEKKFMFTVVGITESQFLNMNPEMTDTIESLRGKIDFRGRISHAESIAALKRADYTIIVRDRNRKNMAGFPTKFVECITCGIHIIANDFSDLASFFPKDEYSCLLKDYSENNLVELIKNRIDCFGKDIRTSTNNPFIYKNYKKIVEEFFRD